MVGLNSVFLDTNRILRPLERRLHAAWHEMRGESATTVPAAAWELARLIDCSSAERMTKSRDDLALRLKMEGNTIGALVEMNLRVQLWWADVWLSKNSPHDIRFLSPDEADKALMLMNNIDPKCFPSADMGAFSTHRDAMIICEVLACGGKVLLTSNMELVDEVLVNRWVRENQQAFDLVSDKVVFPVDEVLLGITRKPDGERKMLDVVLGAYWPDDANATPREVNDVFVGALTKLSMPSSNIKRTARHLLNIWRTDPDPNEKIEMLRPYLPGRTRLWEQRHPAYPRPRP